MSKTREKKTIMTKVYKTVMIADVELTDTEDSGQIIFKKRFAWYRRMTIQDVQDFLFCKDLRLIKIHEFYRVQKGYRIPVEKFEEIMCHYEVPEIFEKTLVPYESEMI